MIDFTSNIVIGQTYLPRFFIIVEFLKTQLPSRWRVKNFYKIKSVCFQTNEWWVPHLEIPIEGIKKNNGIMALQLKNLSKNIVLD